MITEPNCFLELLGLGSSCELWIIETLGLPYRNVLGIIFGNVGEGKVPNRNCFGIKSVIFLCVMVLLCLV